MTSIWSGRKGLQFPCEFSLEQNEEKNDSFNYKENSYHMQLKKKSIFIIILFPDWK